MTSVLVIDDSESVRSVVRRALERFGYRVVEAVNGAEGVAAFANERFDLVLTDMHMPLQSGSETIRRIRALDRTIPIIAVSGSTEESLDGAMALGASFRLDKPFGVDDLLGAVRFLLSGDAGGAGQSHAG